MEDTIKELKALRQELLDDLKQADLNPVQRFSYRCQLSEINAMIDALHFKRDVSQRFRTFIQKYKSRG